MLFLSQPQLGATALKPSPLGQRLIGELRFATMNMKGKGSVPGFAPLAQFE